MEVIYAHHVLTLNSHNEIPFPYPRLAGWTFWINRDDLHSLLSGQIVKPDQPAIEESLSSRNSQKPPSHFSVGQQL